MLYILTLEFTSDRELTLSDFADAMGRCPRKLINAKLNSNADVLTFKSAENVPKTEVKKELQENYYQDKTIQQLTGNAKIIMAYFMARPNKEILNFSIMRHFQISINIVHSITTKLQKRGFIVQTGRNRHKLAENIQNCG